MPLLTVLIPAYCQPAYLNRCLQSLTKQDFHDFEVIVTDDSPGEELKIIIEEHTSKLTITHIQNRPALGTPANWTIGIPNGTGNFIYILHHDDWLHRPNALSSLVNTLLNNPDAGAAFTNYQNVEEETGATHPVILSPLLWKRYQTKPWLLFARNRIGPPSVIMMRRTQLIEYDLNLKWLVDLEGYYRYIFSNHKMVHVQDCLVSIGVSQHQVTASTKFNASIQVNEYLYCLEKNGIHLLRHLPVYDSYWRMLRNMRIRRQSDIEALGWKLPIPLAILKMIKWQAAVPHNWIMFGPFSKIMMTLSFLFK